MTNAPRISNLKSSEQFRRYADLERKAAGACASLLGSTRDLVERKIIEDKLLKSRKQLAFYEEKMREALERGE